MKHAMTVTPIFEAAARTHPGMKRPVNEDAVLCADPCYLVADGMGGHEAGDRASRAAISAFEDSGPEMSLPEIEARIEAARRAVERVSAQTLNGGGCTLTGVIRVSYEDQPFWYILNIGDSRVYLHEGSELTQLTNDHSLHAQLIAEGNPEAAKAPRNVITRALGSSDARHDAWLLPIRTGARLLICSDGLTTELEDEEIRAVLTMGGRPDSVVEELVRRACDAGGRDNISVIVVDTLSGGTDTGETTAQRWDSSMIDTIDPDDDTTIERTRPRR
ncbi:PP2C family protein-serine/threonine phosphatase [Leucobacter sp. GX24907]